MWWCRKKKKPKPLRDWTIGSVYIVRDDGTERMYVLAAMSSESLTFLRNDPYKKTYKAIFLPNKRWTNTVLHVPSVRPEQVVRGWHQHLMSSLTPTGITTYGKDDQ